MFNASRRALEVLVAVVAMVASGLVLTAVEAAPPDCAQHPELPVCQDPPGETCHLSNTAPPGVTGTARFEETLIGSKGTWTGATSNGFSYGWLRDGVVIAGATSTTYVVAAADTGHRLSFRVTATADCTVESYKTVTSVQTAVVAKKTMTNTAIPTISVDGSYSLGVGETARARTGTWTGAGTLTFGYAWKVAGTTVSTGPSYQPVPADAGKTLTLTVTATRPGYETVSASSTAQDIRLGAQWISQSSRWAGVAKVAEEIRLIPGTSETTGPSEVTRTYSWAVDDVPVGNTSLTYRIGPDDLDRRLSVTVDYVTEGYNTRHETIVISHHVKAGDAPRLLTPPAISGERRWSKVLTASPGTWSLTGPVTYQWLRDGRPIAGATARARPMSLADLGHQVSVRVTVSPTGYLPASTVVSAGRIGPVAALEHRAAKPALRGAARVGHRIKVREGNRKLRHRFSPAPTQLRFQWYRNGNVIQGATKRAYRLRKADRHKRIVLRITGLRPGYADGCWKLRLPKVR